MGICRVVESQMQKEILTPLALWCGSVGQLLHRPSEGSRTSLVVAEPSLFWGGNESAGASNVSTDLCRSCTRQSVHIAIYMHDSVPDVVQH